MVAQGLTGGVINYGPLPVVTREKPPESSKDIFNTEVLILSGNLPAVSVGGSFIKLRTQ